MDWNILITTMGPLLGVLLGINAQYIIDMNNAKKAKIKLQKAFRSEIKAILDILDRDKLYVGILEENLARWESEDFESFPQFPRVVKGNAKTDEIYSTIMPVYKSNLCEIGNLDTDIAVSVSKFYMRLMYVIYEWTLFSQKDFWGADHPRPSKIKIVKNNLNYFQETVDIGKNILEKLSQS